MTTYLVLKGAPTYVGLLYRRPVRPVAAKAMAAEKESTRPLASDIPVPAAVFSEQSPLSREPDYPWTNAAQAPSTQTSDTAAALLDFLPS
jgi:hypothetical protein